MISFIRKIRRRLLTDNQFGKYLLYAIGEILLVVVGILIALQVDNWNEDRKKQKEIAQMLTDIEKDLMKNYWLADNPLKFYRTQDSIARRIARNQLTKADYEKNPRLNYFISNWEYYLPAEKNINQFVESEKLVPPGYKPILDALKNLQNFSAVLDDVWSNLEANLDENTKLLTSHAWFVKNDSISNKARQEFFLSDERYEIAAMGYWIQTQNYYDKITRYRAQTMGTLATIKKFKDQYGPDQINTLFQKNGMFAFEPYTCGVEKSKLKTLKTIRASELYGNLSGDTLQFILTNNTAQPITEFSIPPSTFMTIPGSEYFGMEGDYTTLARVTDPEGRCIGTYGAFENGYLLISDQDQ